MMRGCKWTDRAERDLNAGRTWYEHQRQGLGEDFAAEVMAAIEISRERPESVPEIRKGVRGIRCNRFPYRIYFDVELDGIVILAIYHTSRNPDRWADPARD
jgi:plasmid stabilization system protein ParE